MRAILRPGWRRCRYDGTQTERDYGEGVGRGRVGYCASGYMWQATLLRSDSGRSGVVEGIWPEDEARAQAATDRAMAEMLMAEAFARWVEAGAMEQLARSLLSEADSAP